MSNLQLRIMTAAVLAPVTILLIWLGGMSFRVLAVVIGFAIFFEWTTLSASKQTRSGLTAAWAVLSIAAGLLLIEVPSLQILAILAAGAIFLVQRSNWAAAGLLYAGVPMVCLAVLRGETTSGLIAIIYLFALVWATDIFAYFTGRTFGGPKLAPRFSPNKTWSGAIGGVVAAMIAAAAVSYFSFDRVKYPMVILAIMLSVASQIGDLGESWGKRRFGAKDSGKLLPGHGGVMDRVDGLIVAAVMLYVIGALVTGSDTPSAMFIGIVLQPL
ncbi:phosphatidate cytidylyltransferase [Pseudochrobactrum kiredjianiae]|uniref:Phosphatidate cytidylyltransferase n=1 Tax=Pseudochrobactrum kiredjianiae TaxID=386305 RepID=A0ABW3V8Z8_9HYPH|nr:CDP-archaeol synthase [Pseudochrobactrum kiredjianiae]MDM7851365.1 CDP-archaeol synthase [Pseudochrobactrum kiredjianiae]